MKSKHPRQLKLYGSVYKWKVSKPEEDYGAVNVRIWFEGTLYVDQWWHPSMAPNGVSPSLISFCIQSYRSGNTKLPERIHKAILIDYMMNIKNVDCVVKYNTQLNGKIIPWPLDY